VKSHFNIENIKKHRAEKQPSKFLPCNVLRNKVDQLESEWHEKAKPPPLSDYYHSLSKSYKAAKKAGKDVVQLGQQSLQSFDLLIVHDDRHGGVIDEEALNALMETTSLTRTELLTRRGSPPNA